MRQGPKIGWEGCVRLLSALALVLIAFAHSPITPRTLPDATAYAFPDGSVPVICVTLPADDEAPGTSHGLSCDACLISASMVVPAPDKPAGPAFRLTEPIVYVAAEPPARRAAWPHSAPPRAPPLA